MGLALPAARAQAPGTDFSATPTSGCGPLTVQFTDNSTNSPTSWSWGFGDGQISNQQSPSHIYTTPGTYTVTLIATNASGTQPMQKSDYITVNPSPTAAFTSNLTLACAPATIQYTDQSSAGSGPPISSWSWTFGDGNTSSQTNPTDTYSAVGYYPVSLTVTNSAGCSSQFANARYLRVVPGIQPNFTFNQTSVACSAPFTGTLVNQTAGPGTLSYTWAMDNGASPASSTDVNPIVTFPAASTYNITLNATSSLGCSASTQQPLTLTNLTPQLNGPSSVCVNEPATFSDGSTPAPNAVAWNFGDGTTANTLTATKTWSAVGSYTVKLVDSYSTCSDSTSTTVQVVNSPTAAFTASATKSCKAPFTVNFTDGTTPTATSWLWDFGDGQTSTVQNPSHTYTTTGSFTVTLTATVGSGCTSTISKPKFVIIQAPYVSVGGTRTACVQGTGSVNIVNPIPFPGTVDGVASYAWTAPGSNEGTSNVMLPSFTYPAAGSYHLLLTITTNGGCTASVTNGIQIGTAVPAIFTYTPPSGICGNSPVSFNYPTAGYQYLWDFGDSSTATIQDPTHSYSKINPVPFNVSLTVTHNGCPTTTTQTLTVNPPIANFGYKVVCPGGPGGPVTVNFIDSSYTDNSPTMTYNWDYGDGNTLLISAPPYAPPHTYTTAGSYTVTLTVTDGTACPSSSKPKTINLPTVTTSFTPVTQNVCENTGFTLTSTSTVTPDTSVIKKYQWTVGTTTGSGPVFTDTISTPGNYPVSLTLTDANGCTYAPATSSINIMGPIAKFTGPAIGGGCRNAAIAFTDQSTAYPGNGSPPAPPSSIVSELWTYGDGTQGTTPSHTYADTGTYKVALKVTDNIGCSSVDTTPVQITGPIASFGMPDSFYCPNIPLLFTDSSTGYTLTETWNFGDGTTGTTNPHTFTASPTPYNVTLTVTDRYNCTAAVTKPVIIQKPVAAFNIYDTTAICTPLQTTFAEHGQYYDSLYWEFGDGSSSTLDSTTHFYNTIDTFTATLFLQGPGGCLASASRRVLLQNPQKNTKFTYSPVQGCDSVPVQFAITPPPFTNFSVHFNDNTVDSSGNTAPFHVYRSPGTYGPQVFLTDQTGCIVQVPGQSGQIQVLGATPFFSVNEHSFCDSSTVLFTDYTVSNDGFSTETYNFGDGSAPQSQSPGTGAFNISHQYDLPGTWPVSLTVTTTDNCVSTYKDTIMVYQTPHPAITTTGLLCPGPIQFDGTTTPAVDSTIWSWNFGDGQTAAVQNPSVTLAPNTYNVTLTTSVPFGCKADTTTTVTIYAPPSIKGPKEITTGVGIAVTIPFTYGSGITTYGWTPTQNLSCTTCPNPVATLIDPTQYQVTVTDSNGCTNSDTILIKTLCNGENYFLPNTFSPNGDGVNDYFYPRGSNVFNIQSLSVFNRWGQLVFQRRNFPANAENMGWDGTFNGHPAAADAYVYIAEVICENSQVVTLHGSVTLIR
jgi:gliding motility-associated-like protein